MKRSSQTVIVGGGLIGICAAHALVRRGAAVTVLERDRVGGAASFGNAGCIAPGHGPINRRLRLGQALRWLLDPGSPIHVSPRPDPELARWLWRFRARCSPRHLEHCAGVLGPLGHRTRELFGRIMDEESLDCDYRDEGYYDVYRTDAGIEAGTAELPAHRRHGYAPQVLSGGEIRELAPALSAEVRGAVRHPEGATCDPHRFVVELAARCEAKGVTIRRGIDVRELRVSGSRVDGVISAEGEPIEAGCVLLATGAYSQHLLRPTGFSFPLQAAKGYHRDLVPRPGAGPSLDIPCLLAETLVFCTPMRGFVRYAGTLEFSGVNDEIRRRRLDRLTRGARQYITGHEDARTRSEWCGLRPCLPDGLPAVGPVPGTEGLFVANGLAMMGLTLGPVTGELIADAILERETRSGLAPLAPDRF